MQMNARIVLAFIMSLCIFIYDPYVAISGLIVFGIAYYILFKIVKKRLQKNGEAISEVNIERFRLMNDGFGGIKDILLHGKHEDFIKRFVKTSNVIAFSEVLMMH